MAPMREQAQPPLGILAAGGALPLDVAAAAHACGRAVHIVALEGIADQAVARFPHTWASLGQIGRMLAAFRTAGCRELLIAGAMQRPDLLRLRIDAGFLRHLPTVLSLTRGGDDSVLRRVVSFFEQQGFAVRGVGDVAPGLLAAAGPSGRHRPAQKDQRAIGRAVRLIEALGAFDIGQAVVATADGIIAVEGVTGTDAMLRMLAGGTDDVEAARGGVLVKLAKPGQEMRVDLPAIGAATIERAAAAGLAGIAVGAGSAIVLERAAMLAAADRAGLFVTGIEMPASTGKPIALVTCVATETIPSPPLAVLGRAAPTPSDRRDVAVARRLLAVTRREDAGRAAVVASEHVLVVSGALAIEPLIRPLGDRRHWGLRTFRGRIGTLALDLSAGTMQDAAPVRLDVDFFRIVQEARLAGVVCFGAAIPESTKADVIAWANEAKVFLMSE